MDNTSVETLRVPGFGGYPLEDEMPVWSRFANGIREWKQVPAITRREFAMVAVMNELTDRVDWQNGIFDPSTVDGWRKDAMDSEPLMSNKAWEWCVAELRDKAAYLKEHGYVRVLDTGSCVCKSDTLAPDSLCAQLQSGLEPVIAKHRDRGEASGISTYVDPSLYPLVYGTSLVLSHGGQVMRHGQIKGDASSGLERAPDLPDKRVGSETVQSRMGDTRHRPWEYVFSDLSWPETEAYLWSYKYQWLPSDVDFTNPGSTSVRLASYINNLSDVQGSLYACIEQLISSCIEPWNGCLIKGQPGWNDESIRLDDGGYAPFGNVRRQRGRVPCRIITYGVEWVNEAEDWMTTFDGSRRKRLAMYDKLRANLKVLKQEQPLRDADEREWTKYNLRIREAESKIDGHDMKHVRPLPEPTPELWARAKEFLERPEPGSDARIELPEGWEKVVGTLIKQRVSRFLHFKHPEPGTAFSYEEWKSGTHDGRAIVDMVTHRPIRPDVIPPRTPHETYNVKLQDFRNKGLQVIVRVEGVELSPEKPEYPGSAWTIEGQKNEHIVAIAMLAYDVDNVTASEISFRQETQVGEAFFHHGPFLYEGNYIGSWWNQPAHAKYKGCQMEQISEVFGFDPAQMCGDLHNFALPVQEIGKVALPQGRLLAFPNVIEYRREPFRLKDAERPGHHRVMTVMLVDPNYRICSTRNVPPQQAEGRFTAEEAEGFKSELEKEHAWMQYARYNLMGTFFFC
jgi:hypothetical protein